MYVLPPFTSLIRVITRQDKSINTAVTLTFLYNASKCVESTTTLLAGPRDPPQFGITVTVIITSNHRKNYGITERGYERRAVVEYSTNVCQCFYAQFIEDLTMRFENP